MQIVLAPCFALASQQLTKKGYSSRLARGAFGCACVVGAGAAVACLPMLPLGPLKILLIGLAFSIGSVIFTLGSTLIGEICPSSQRGALLGITNSIHTLAGLIAPVVMGLIVLGLVAALLIHPEADLRRFRRHGIAPAAAGDAMSSSHTRSHVSARLPESGLAD
jgi:sugar phosphate permease